MLDRNSPEIIALTNALFHSDPLERIVKRASAVVRNPVAVIDSAYNMLAWSHSDVQDEIWLARIKEGYWDYDFVATVKQFTDRRGHGGERSAIVTGLSPLRRKIDMLVLRGGMLGYSVVLEADNSLEDTDDEVYAYVRDVLTKAMAAERAYYVHRGEDAGDALMLRDLLHMRFPNRVLLRERIRGSEFDRDTIFQTLALSLDAYAPQGGDKLKPALQRLLPRSWSSYEADHIVILLDRAATLRENPDAPDEFAAFLEANGLRAGLSAPFSDLGLLPERYRQAGRALEVYRKLAPRFPFPVSGRVIPYEYCKLPDMLDRMPKEEREAFCHEAIAALAVRDAEQGASYLPTVFAYLNAGKSIHAAAEALHVHHNTVYYRLTKAKELYGLDFSSEYRNLHYHLSCIILLHMA